MRAANAKALRLVAIVQANLTLAPGVEIASDPDKPGVVLTFKSCLNSACLADVELSEDEARHFRSQPRAAKMSIRNAAGEQLSLSISAKGLDQALAALAAQGK